MSTYRYAAPIVYGARTQHSATVIMLHGLGDSGDGWSFLPSQLRGDFKHVKFVFPHAPNRRITLNMGLSMPGWYDIASLDGINQQEDSAGLHESKRYVESLVEQEVAAGVTSDRVVVAGFSQGGAVALMMLRSQLKLAGVIGLSTYVPLRDEGVVSEANKGTKVLMGHGNADQVVAFRYGEASKDMLEKAGVPVEFKVYPGMGHSACPEELLDIEHFLSAAVPAL